LAKSPSMAFGARRSNKRFEWLRMPESAVVG
jgi:hypothetical protein